MTGRYAVTQIESCEAPEAWVLEGTRETRMAKFEKDLELVKQAMAETDRAVNAVLADSYQTRLEMGGKQ